MSKFVRSVALLLLFAAAGPLLAAPTVRVAVFNNPPLITYDVKAGHAGGIFMEVLHDTAAHEGWDVRYVPGTYAQGLQRLEAGEVDIMPATPYARAREDALTFTRETLATSWGRIYVKRSSTIGTVQGLAGKKVALIKGSILQRTLLQRTSEGGSAAQLIEYDDVADGFRAVAAGRADAVLCNGFSGAIYARDLGLRATPVLLAPYGFRYAGKRDPAAERLLDALDVHLLLLKTDPSSFYYQALQKLERSDARDARVPGWVSWGAAGALLIVALLLGWVLTVRRAAARIAASERELRRTHEDLDRITDNSLHLIAVFDADFSVRRVSRACEKLLGFRPEELVGKSVLDWVPPERRPTARSLLEEVRAGTPLEGHEIQLLRADGKVTPALLSLVWSDTVQEFYAIAHDDTQRHELIERLQRRTRQLQAANRDLQTFAQSVSHDLRAPAAAVVGFVGKVLKDEGATLQDRSRQLLRRAHAASRRMDTTIASLLRLARVTEGGVQRRVCDVTAMCLDVVAALRNVEPEREVTVEIQPGMRAVADRELLRHVFDNLLANAWKFTSRQPCARITVGCAHDPDGAVFFVRDDGAGFDMEYAHNLFVPFGRLHSENEFSGTGIGLCIAQRVVAAHGGQIWAEGAPGEGAVFRLTLGQPGIQPPAGPVAPPRVAPADSAAAGVHWSPTRVGRPVSGVPRDANAAAGGGR